jgi:hypothetical protein
MANIEVDFAKYLPGLSTFYSYFEVLKTYHFVEDVKVIEKDGSNYLRIYRNDQSKVML